MTTAAFNDTRRRYLDTQLEAVRERTHRIIGPLSEDALERQHESIMSPLVWDVGHVGNFEELWLLRVLDGRTPHDERLDAVYNPFENPRWCRGDLDLLDRDEAVIYLRDVRADALQLLRHRRFDPEDTLTRDGYLFDMVVQHEAQHQETMLQALDLRPDLEPYPWSDPNLHQLSRRLEATTAIAAVRSPPRASRSGRAAFNRSS